MIDRGEFPFVPPIFKRNSPSPRKRSRSPSPMLLIPLTQPSAKRAMANILPLSPPPTPPPTDNDGNGDTEPGESKVKNIRLSRTHALMRLSKNIQAEIDDSPPSYEMAEAIKSSSNAADHGVWNDDIGEFLPAAELSVKIFIHACALIHTLNALSMCMFIIATGSIRSHSVNHV